MWPADLRDEFQRQRRAFLLRAAGGLGGVALHGLLAAETRGAAPSAGAGAGSAVPRPQRAPRAKHVIYLHMIGAPSQLDLFDAKPELVRRDGETCPAELTRGKRFAFIGNELRLAGSTFKFAQHGAAGQEVSELLPQFSRVLDEVAIVRSIHTDEINHAPAQMLLHTGFGRGGRPSLGAWVSYGLGSENQDLPAFVVLQSGPLGGAGTALWAAGFLPSVYQGIPFRSSGDPVLFLSNPPGQTRDTRRRVLDALGELNRSQWERVGDPEIATRISQYEMAFRMQAAVPELMDIGPEPPHILDLYGVDPAQPSFARNCLLARRLVERGVRIVELYDADWDHHADLSRRLPAKCRDIDRGMAALVTDLRQRGLLDETLIVWCSEFGRTPLRQGISGDGETTRPGRDHHKDAYTMWLAGGGIRGGTSVGKTDEFGFNIVERPVHTHDLNATLLHLLGIDHEKLTYKYQGREFRLTDIHGHVVPELLA